MRIRRATLIALLLLVASAVAGVAQPRLGRSAGAPLRTITVSGHGTVATVPDRASFDFAVEARAQTAAGAIARTGEAANAVLRAAKDAGVPAADIQTSQVSLTPQTTGDGTSIVGYLASETITAETSLVAKPWRQLAYGADGVSGPSLSRSDQDDLYREALRSAVDDAHGKAGALAAAAGLSLGAVQAIVEGDAAPTPLPFAAGKADATLPIEPGTQTVDASVTVTYSVV